MTTATATKLPAVERSFTEPQALTGEWVTEQYADLERRLESDPTQWLSIYAQMNDLDGFIGSRIGNASLAYQQDTTDEAAEAEYQRLVSEVGTAAGNAEARFSRTLVSLVGDETVRAELGALFMDFLNAAVRLNDPVNDELVAEAVAVSSSYTRLLAQARIEWNGESLTLTHMRKALSEETDPAERRRVLATAVSMLVDNEETLDTIYDRLCDNRQQQARNLGYRSYVDMRYEAMGRFSYGTAEVASFREAIKEHIVPLATEIGRELAAVHGTEKLHPADQRINTQLVPKLRIDVNEEVDVIEQVFSGLYQPLGDAFHELRQNDRIDLLAREGKAGGAFCMTDSETRMPFVFCNSTGAADDIGTLVHEAGHALQSLASRPIDPLPLRSPGYEACEIHSMGLELLAMDHLDPCFGPDTPVFAYNHLTETVLSIPYMAAVDEFQHRMYEGDQVPPSPAARSAIWRELMEIYLPWVDWNADAGWTDHYWKLQRHIYMYPFYYIDYALAQVTAWQLWLSYRQDGQATIERYWQLCAMGGAYTLPDMYETAGLSLPFDAQVVRETTNGIRQAISAYSAEMPGAGS